MITEDLTPAAVEAARLALVEQVGADLVGDHLATLPEEGAALTLTFASTQRGYLGWHWAVTVAAPEGAETVTISEVVLLPGDGAVLAPRWVPWRERIRPGDLSPGDVLPVEEDDPRLVPAYFAGDPGDDDVDQAEIQQMKSVANELGLGRSRVLSLEGRQAAAERWLQGEHGPDVPLAQSAPGRCVGCGFLVRLAGPLSRHFGVCANEFANDDGCVVALNHGCGAHSEAQLRKKQLPVPLADPVFDSVTRGDLERF